MLPRFLVTVAIAILRLAAKIAPPLEHNAIVVHIPLLKRLTVERKQQ